MEKGVVLTAVTATTPLHELRLDCSLVDFDGPTEKRVQPLKCDPTGVENVQISQHRQGWLAWACLAYAGKG